MTGPELIREDPAPKRRGAGSVPPSPITVWLHAIREHPGEWFRLPDLVSPSTAANIKGGAYAGVAAGEFEAMCRGIHVDSDGRRVCALYARYVAEARLGGN